MSNRESEWQKAAREQQERQDAAAQEASKSAAAYREAQKEAAETHAEGMALINGVVNEFLDAMCVAGNPGRRSFMSVLMRDLELRFRYSNPDGVGEPIGSHWYEHDGGHVYSSVKVYANGRWRYTSGTESVIGAGPAGDSYGSSSTMTSEDPPSTYRNALSYQGTAYGIRKLLTRILLRHNVKLPSDS